MDLNVTEVIGIIIAVLGVASAITALTPTPKDDAIVASIRKFIASLSVLEHKDIIKDKTKPTFKAPIPKSFTEAFKKIKRK